MRKNLRKIRGVLTTSLLAFCLSAQAKGGDSLERYKWKNRVLVLLSTPNDDRLVEQRSRMNANAEALKERDLILLEETDPSGPLHRQFKPKTKFGLYLVGKDGGTKWQSSEVVGPQVIFDKIDSMPMRELEKGN